jgi:hypothetical protein
MLLGAGKIVFEIAAAGIDERACALFTSRHGSLRALTQSLRQSRVRLTLPLPMGPYKPEETIGVGGRFWLRNRVLTPVQQLNDESKLAAR